jgi:hypothetical protein
MSENDYGDIAASMWESQKHTVRLYPDGLAARIIESMWADYRDIIRPTRFRTHPLFTEQPSPGVNDNGVILAKAVILLKLHGVTDSQLATYGYVPL